MTLDEDFAVRDGNASGLKDEAGAIFVLRDSLGDIVRTQIREPEQTTKRAELSQSSQAEHVRDNDVRGHLAEDVDA